MPLVLASSLAYLHVAAMQAAVLQDTAVARMVPQRDLFEWTGIVLQAVALVLAIVALVSLVVVLRSLRRTVQRTNTAIEHLVNETKPLFDTATRMAAEAREVVALVRTDVERLAGATGMVTAQLSNAAESAGRRIDEVNAVLDVLQKEIEQTAIGAVAVVKGVATSTTELGRALRGMPLSHEGTGVELDDHDDEPDRESDDEFSEELEDDLAALDEELDELDELEERFDSLEEEVVHALDGDAADEPVADDRPPRATNGHPPA